MHFQREMQQKMEKRKTKMDDNRSQCLHSHKVCHTVYEWDTMHMH